MARTAYAGIIFDDWERWVGVATADLVSGGVFSDQGFALAFHPFAKVTDLCVDLGWV